MRAVKRPCLPATPGHVSRKAFAAGGGDERWRLHLAADDEDDDDDDARRREETRIGRSFTRVIVFSLAPTARFIVVEAARLAYIKPISGA